MIVKLNKNQFDYLSYSFSEEQNKLILKQTRIENNFIFIDISYDEVIYIRDWAMDKQIQIGFDMDYELTSEGKILEEIIDLFYTDK